jgi:protein-L-isoaspartate(D-aspartate) O-methyltransferase
MTAAFVHSAAESSSDARRAMVDSQLRTNEISDPTLLAAIAATARESHVPVAQKVAAYTDRALPLGGGRSLNPALTTARLISELDVAADQSILLIGAATGYAAAILARLGARVTAVEESAELIALAQSALQGIDRVTLVNAALPAGAPDNAPYDALMVDGSIELLPSSLLDQLADGAVIVTGIVDEGVTRLGRAVHVAGATAIHPLPFVDLECVHLPGFAPPLRFTF